MLIIPRTISLCGAAGGGRALGEAHRAKGVSRGKKTNVLRRDSQMIFSELLQIQDNCRRSVNFLSAQFPNVLQKMQKKKLLPNLIETWESRAEIWDRFFPGRDRGGQH